MRSGGGGGEEGEGEGLRSEEVGTSRFLPFGGSIEVELWVEKTEVEMGDRVPSLCQLRHDSQRTFKTFPISRVRDIYVAKCQLSVVFATDNSNSSVRWSIE